MDRAQKRELVTQLNEQWKSSGVLVVAHYKGMTVAQMTDFRKRVREAGGVVKVTKNRLAKLALQGTDVEAVSDLLKGQICVAYSEDPIGAAKASVKYAKENDKFSVVGGFMGQQVLDKGSVTALATLPSLDQLRAKIVGLLQAPATKIAGILQAPAGQLARVVGAYAAKDAA